MDSRENESKRIEEKQVNEEEILRSNGLENKNLVNFNFPSSFPLLLTCGDFPHNLTIEMCKLATEGLREFRWSKKEGSLLVIGYDFCFGATFPDPKSEIDPKKAFLLKVRR